MLFFRHCRVTLLLLVVLFSSSALYSKKSAEVLDTKIGGLEFKSKGYYATERTTLSLFSKPLPFSNITEFSFDCKINDFEQFGYVVRLIGKDKAQEKVQFQLITHPTTDNEDSVVFELYSAINHSSIRLRLPKVEKVYQFSFLFNSKDSEIEIRCNERHTRMTDINMKAKDLNIVFGLWGANKDVASMTIGNVRLKDKSRTKFFWPLDEFEGNVAYEIVSGIQSEVKNPNWLRKDHYNWKKLTEFTADEMAGVIYKEKENEIYIVNKDSLFRFDCSKLSMGVQLYKNTRPFSRSKHFSILNEESNQVISYDFSLFSSQTGDKAYSILNEDDMTWSSVGATSTKIIRHHHSKCWVANDCATFFGGYGDYTYYNSFSTYNYATDAWVNPRISGDFIHPRTHSVTGTDKDSSLLYVFGGFGNPEGQQVLGGRNYYDLYEVNMQTGVSEMLLDYPNNEQYDFIPRGQLIVDNGAKDFYTLGSQMIDRASLQLYHISPDQGLIEAISDSISAIFSNMAGDAFLFLNHDNKQLFSVVRSNSISGTSIISIYKLNFPPSNFLSITQYEESKSGLIYLIAFVCAVMLIVVLVLLRKRGKSNGKTLKSVKEFDRVDKNSIWFLGGFKVFDPKGQDITYRFSKKLKELFILVYFETIDSGGINSKDLSEILWPGMDKEHQKNNRGVTINNLRKALDDLEGIELVSESNKWKIVVDESCYFDYFTFITSIENKDYLQNPVFVASMLSNGNILPHLHFGWLDKYKSNYELRCTATLHTICAQFYKKKSYLSCFETAQIIHDKFDEIDETALAYKVKSLNKLRSGKKSHIEYEQFKKRFFAIYDEKYDKSISEIEELFT